MAEIILKAIKPLLADLLDKVKSGAPSLIDAVLAWLASALPGSVDKVTAGFRTLYGDATGRLAAWLPSIKPGLITAVDGAVAFVKTKVIAKL